MKLRPLLALSALCLSTPGWTQSPPIKPGLWETKVLSQEMDGKPAPQMGAAMAQLDKLPPEQRKMIEQRMAQSGVGMQGGAIRNCISAEALQKNRWAHQPSQNCQTQVLEHGARQWRTRFSCTTPKSEGEALTVFDGDTGYSVDVRSTSEHNGQRHEMKMKMQARWVGADCGGLKPMQIPKGQ